MRKFAHSHTFLQFPFKEGSTFYYYYCYAVTGYCNCVTFDDFVTSASSSLTELDGWRCKRWAGSVLGIWTTLLTCIRSASCSVRAVHRIRSRNGLEENKRQYRHNLRILAGGENDNILAFNVPNFILPQRWPHFQLNTMAKSGWAVNGRGIVTKDSQYSHFRESLNNKKLPNRTGKSPRDK